MTNKIWITSDTHFNHKFMIDKRIRQNDYQDKIISQWKKHVGDKDTIFHLGDVIFSRPGELRDILNGLPGYKILIKGNHDKNTDNWYLSHGFNEVHDSYNLLHYSLYKHKYNILLTHKPVVVDKFINVCGHLHNYKGDNIFRHKDCLYLNNNSRVYSQELEDYKPVLLIDMISPRHKSIKYFNTIGLKNIRIKYYLNKLKKKFNSLMNYKIF